MPWFKCAMLFRQGANGWSESWYWLGSNATLAAAQLESLLPQRATMLGSTTYIDAIRVTDVYDPRMSYLKDINTTFTQQPEPSDHPSATIVGEIRQGELYRRPYYMRGYPDTWVAHNAGSGVPSWPDAAKTNFAAYVLALKNKKFAFRATTKDAASAIGYNIKDFNSTEPGGFVQITIDVPDLFSSGERCMIKNVKGASTLGNRMINQTFLVRAEDGMNVVLNTKYNSYPEIDKYVGGLAYRRATFFYVPDSGELIRVGRRKAGRAFFVVPGRRPS